MVKIWEERQTNWAQLCGEHLRMEANNFSRVDGEHLRRGITHLSPSGWLAFEKKGKQFEPDGWLAFERGGKPFEAGWVVSIWEGKQTIWARTGDEHLRKEANDFDINASPWKRIRST